MTKYLNEKQIKIISLACYGLILLFPVLNALAVRNEIFSFSHLIGRSSPLAAVVMSTLPDFFSSLFSSDVHLMNRMNLFFAILIDISLIFLMIEHLRTKWSKKLKIVLIVLTALLLFNQANSFRTFLYIREIVDTFRLSIGNVLGASLAGLVLFLNVLQTNKASDEIQTTKPTGTHHYSKATVTLIKRLNVGGQEYQPQVREVNLGFSWSTFLLSPFFAALFRKDWNRALRNFLILLIPSTIFTVLINRWLSLQLQLLTANTFVESFRIESSLSDLILLIWLLIISLWVIDFFLAFKANQRFVQRLLGSGWEPANDKDRLILQDIGLIGDSAFISQPVETVALTENPFIKEPSSTSIEDITKSNTASVVEELTRLKELLDSGVINEEEFKRLKSKVIK